MSSNYLEKKFNQINTSKIIVPLQRNIEKLSSCREIKWCIQTATRKSQDRCIFLWWSLKKTLEVMAGSDTGMSRLSSSGQSPCWTSFIQFLHLKKKDTSYHFHETFGVSAGNIILFQMGSRKIWKIPFHCWEV